VASKLQSASRDPLYPSGGEEKQIAELALKQQQSNDVIPNSNSKVARNPQTETNGAQQTKFSPFRS
jgi:hypothetical protein